MVDFGWHENGKTPSQEATLGDQGPANFSQALMVPLPQKNENGKHSRIFSDQNIICT